MGRPDEDLRLRVARAADDVPLAALDARAWSPQSGFPTVTQAARRARTFFTADSPPHVHLICEIGGQLVGYVRVRPATPLPENGHVFGVLGLAVAPEARRRGVASKLLAAAGEFARTRGARKLSLRVLGTNDAAMRLYEKLGFEREGVLRGEFLIDGQYVDDILMTRYLDNAPRD
jgi:ribosomal protein S18 acetylase RimI-like enzyme